MTPQRPWSWYWSLGSHVFESHHDAIRSACQAAGVHSVEMHPFQFEGKALEQLEGLEQDYAEAGVQIDSFHLPFGAQDDLANFYETERRRAVERTRFWLERMPALKVRIAVQHPSTNRSSVDVEGLDPFLRQLGRSLETLLPVAESNGVLFALENMPPGLDGGRFGSRLRHFERFVEEFDHPSLRFCLDTGHALMAGGPEGVGSFFEVMAPRLAAFHLADNAGDRDSHLAPGHGLVDWDAFFRQAARLDHRHGMCVEAPPFAPAPYRPEAWKELFEGVDELVRRALRD
ncbi:MAG: hypothetical protein DRP97_06510 [Candidatus Latescibacterota bacterium]|nr:MAG: hypothetical protein DRP97_06510 [Candidatus Latescibacterota bacterium]